MTNRIARIWARLDASSPAFAGTTGDAALDALFYNVRSDLRYLLAENERLRPYEPSGRISIVGTGELQCLRAVVEAARMVGAKHSVVYCQFDTLQFWCCAYCNRRTPYPDVPILHHDGCPWLALQSALAALDGDEG